MRILWLAAALSIGVAGCGFHLRHSVPVAPQLQRVYLMGVSEHDAFYKSFEELIQRSGGVLVERPELADTIVKIDRIADERRTLSLNRGGKTSEFDLYFRVTYEVVSAQGEILLPKQETEVQRDYFNDQLAATAKSEEESLIRTEMRREVAETLFRRLNYSLNQRQARTKP